MALQFYDILVFAFSIHWFASLSFEPSWGVLNTILCDKVCQWLVAGWWFSLGTLVSSTNKTNHHDITEIFLKVVLNTITPPLVAILCYDFEEIQWKQNIAQGVKAQQD